MAVACVRNAKFASVKVIDKYELNVLRRSDPTSLDKKNGVAVISTKSISLVTYFDIRTYCYTPFQGSRTAAPNVK